MKNIYDYFKDYNKLFYWLLMFTSWLLSADIVSNLFLNKNINGIFKELNIAELMSIFVFQILFLLTSLVIYEIIRFVRGYIPKISSTNNDYDFYKEYLTYSELLNLAVKENNQTMYNYYKDSKDKIEFIKSQKYLCFAVILLVILDLFIDKSTLRFIIENFNFISIYKKAVIILFVIFDILGLLIFINYHNSYSIDCSWIKKHDK